MNVQYREKKETIKQNQIDTQKVKYSTKFIYNRFNEDKDMLSDLENRIAIREHKKKNTLKIARDSEKSI